MDNKTEWRRSRDRLVRTLTSLGFPGELGNAIVKNLGSPRAMDRMTVYLENVKPKKVEKKKHSWPMLITMRFCITASGLIRTRILSEH